MGYLSLSAALLAGVTKGFFGKKTSGIINGFRDSIFANIIRMVICVLIGLLILFFSSGLSAVAIPFSLVLLSMLSGVATSVFVVTWLLSVRKNAYMLVDVFLMLGVLVPIILSNILFGEAVRPIQLVGIAVLFVSVWMMSSYNSSVKAKPTLLSFLLLALCGFSNGIADFSGKLFVKDFPEIPISVFNLYTYLFSALTLLLCFVFLKKPEASMQKSDFKKIFIYIVAMAICLFANSYFKTVAAQYLDSVVLYPLNQGASLILSTAMSALFFKEKPTAKCYIGLIFAFIGLIAINLL